MDLKKMSDAHLAVKKCLSGECDHKKLSSCMDKIAAAHDVIGEELKGEAEKSLSRIKGDLVQKDFNALDKNDPDIIHKAIRTIRSSGPELVD
jgi:hypothetical protein